MDEKELESLKIDAERYRFLRNQTTGKVDQPSCWKDTGYGEGFPRIEGDDLDALIDKELDKKAVESLKLRDEIIEECAVFCESMGAMEALEGEDEASAAMVRVADRQSQLCADGLRKLKSK